MSTIYEILEGIEPEAFVGVDAITLTATTGVGVMAIQGAISELAPKIEQEERKRFSTQGATGYSQGPLRYAEKVSGTHRRLWAILMVTGPMSQSVLRYSQFCTKATRIDMRVDVKLGSNVVDLAERYYKFMGAEKSKARYIASLTGQTLYPNENREATYYTRIYDKSFEYGEELGRVWRYEIEVKRAAAQGMLDLLIEVHDIEAFISETVFGVIKSEYNLPVPRKGIKPRINYAGLKASTADVKLDWIKRNVGPSVRKLLSIGLGDDVLAALGVKEIRQHEFSRDDKMEKGEGQGI